MNGPGALVFMGVIFVFMAWLLALTVEGTVNRSTANRFAIVALVFLFAAVGCFIGAALWKALS